MTPRPYTKNMHYNRRKSVTFYVSHALYFFVSKKKKKEVFFLCPIENRNKELYRGMTMTTVDKKTGKIGYFNIMSDLDLFQSSKKKNDIPSVMNIRINKA